MSAGSVTADGVAASDVVSSRDVFSSSVDNLSGMYIAAMDCSRSMVSNMFFFKRSFRVVNNLPFNWNVLEFLDFSLLGNVFNFSFGNILRNILSEIFNCVIVGD